MFGRRPCTICLLVLLYYAGCHADPTSQVMIPCDNVELVLQLQQHSIPYRCLTNVEDADTVKKNVETHSEGNVHSQKTATEESSTFTESLCDGGHDCISNTKFENVVPIINSLHKTKPKPKPATSKVKVDPTHCEDTHHVFIAELGGCYPLIDGFHLSHPDEKHLNKHPENSVLGVLFNLNVPFFNKVKCKNEEVFVEALGLCLPKGEADTHTANTPAKISFNDPAICPSGTMYSSEIDLCLPYVKPLKTQETLEFLVNEATAEELTPYEIIRRRCPEGMAYVSEIHLCATFAKPTEEHIKRMTKEAQAVKDADATTTPDPFRLTLSPGTPDQVGAVKCQDNQVYISELDICVDYEPHRPES